MTTPITGGIKVVVFDAVGTLLEPNPKPADVYAAVGGRHGSKLQRSFVSSAFREAFDFQERHDQSLRLATNEARELERWRTIVGSVLHDVADKESCFQELWRHFGQPANWSWTPGVAELFSALRERDLKIAIASNFDSRLRAVLNGFPQSRHLHDVVISSEVGWRKPAQEFFAEVSRRLSRRPAEILFVGDHIGNDYEGARQAGMQAVLFDPAGKQTATSLRRIKNLTDLLALQNE